MPSFIFWVEKQVFITNYALDKWYFFIKSIIVMRDSIKNHNYINLSTE